MFEVWIKSIQFQWPVKQVNNSILNIIPLVMMGWDFHQCNKKKKSPWPGVTYYVFSGFFLFFFTVNGSNVWKKFRIFEREAPCYRIPPLRAPLESQSKEALYLSFMALCAKHVSNSATDRVKTRARSRWVLGSDQRVHYW